MGEGGGGGHEPSAGSKPGALAATEPVAASRPAALETTDAPRTTRQRASLPELLAELRRRRVFRVVVGYGLFSFAVLQVVEPVLHAYDLPAWLLTAVVTALAVGLPVAVILSWLFDLTAQGIQRTPSSAGPRAITLSRGRLAALLTGVGLLAALPGVGWYAWRRWHAPATPAATAASAATPSIAVLPFADMSPQHDQEYFADGVAEEILNALAHVEGLKVIGRTSSFSFKGRNEDLRRIGQQLDVAHVLEGSLRKDRDQIRVTAQLIRVADGSHVWSETYERTLTGIFQVQDEIARAVVTKLQGALLPERRPPVPQPGTTPAAYDQYLAGLHAGAEDVEGYRQAIAAFERAVALDPRYAPAWAQLAMVTFWKVTVYGGDARAELGRAAVAVQRAVDLAPGLASGFLARGLLRGALQWDWKGSQADFERALALDPGSALAKRRYGVLLCALGRQADGARWLEEAVALDPLDAGSWNTLGSTYVDLGRMDLARRALQRALAIKPTHVLALQNLGDIDLLEGRPEAALAIYRTINSEFFRLEGEAMALHSLGRQQEAGQALARLEARYGASAPNNVAEVHGWRGDGDAAFRWLERATAIHDPGLRELKVNRYLRSLRADPRYAALLLRMNLPVD